MYEGDKLCNDCFNNRKSSASDTKYQDLLEKNWGLYFIPFVGLGLTLARLKKSIIDDCHDVWHVYINGNHEVWHDSKTNEYDKQKCKSCCNFYSYFYELVTVK